MNTVSNACYLKTAYKSNDCEMVKRVIKMSHFVSAVRWPASLLTMIEMCGRDSFTSFPNYKYCSQLCIGIERLYFKWDLCLLPAGVSGLFFIEFQCFRAGRRKLIKHILDVCLWFRNWHWKQVFHGFFHLLLLFIVNSSFLKRWWIRSCFNVDPYWDAVEDRFTGTLESSVLFSGLCFRWFR